MRKTLAALALVLAASAVCLGQTNAEAAQKEAAQKEVNLGGRAYRAGRFAEAEQRFRRALELDPEGKNLRVFIARSVHQQFKPGVMTPENVAAGERAIAAYQEVLARDPANEDAYKATVFIYGHLKRDDKVVEMLTQRGNDFSVANEKRAEAFVTLASRHWQCAYDVTEQKENKTTEQKENKTTEQQQPDKTVVKYKMPADQSDFLKARQCASDGLQFIEQALTLDPNSRGGWSFKANLLREAAKLAEMEGDAAQKAEYERLHGEAAERQQRLAAATPPPAVEAGDASAPASPAQGAAAPKKTVVKGGVLNGKAVSKPQPSYSEEARRARAQGTVTVRVLIDEEGRVIEAQAISGHELLRAASEAAARKARFSPTLLSGQPVKVEGLIVYNFLL
jgi:TonB family protein